MSGPLRLTFAAAAVVALLVAATPASAYKRASSRQAAAITRAVQTSTVGDVVDVPRSRYAVTHRRISTVSPSWAYARIQPRARYRATMEGAEVLLVALPGTRNWVVVDLGTALVGCGVAPTSVLTDLTGEDPGCPPDESPFAPARTAQSAPVTSGAAIYVAQASITRSGGILQVRLASTGVTGATVLAQTSAPIPSAVSAPARSALQVALAADGTGTVTVLGPKNATEPDSVSYGVRWTAGDEPSIELARPRT